MGLLAMFFKKITTVFRSIAYTVGAVHFVTCYFVDVTLTKGPSMSPEISENGAILLYAPTPLMKVIRGKSYPYRKNDVVISVSPVDANKRICKRIVATCGDVINGGKVPPGHLWLQGDNADNSLDSRHYGAVSSGLILGRVFFIFPPKGNLKVL
ncbi:signal peptidase I family member protein [Theileria equi strain WA]|uniref:Signal peptidase I family member protein n=1 Tax=Theileria equi strain WA TaxID=1537102 RepID=L1LFJ6_THEEQ|nr:signal peptidase I family member protein [Theileria equi strain WA]EKX74126.1 signal peptidase I family member protein [Theileria equi strain WA]|eukprot:XP_004833578.1 signal peptidase I family member protein [Theileria equi strain WA]